MTSPEAAPRTAAKDADYRHAHIVGKDRCKCGVTWVQGGGWKGFAFHLEDVLVGIAIEAEAAAGTALDEAQVIAAVEAELHRVLCQNAKHRSVWTGECKVAPNIGRGLYALLAGVGQSE